MRHVALLAAFVVLVSVAAGATVAAADQPAGALPHDDRFSPASPGDSPPAALHSGVPHGQLASAVGAPRTNFTVSLREDGSARWTVETRIPLDDEPERDAFREYASAYESGAADGGPTVAPFRNAAVAASEATDREMSIVQVNRTATLANGSGVLRLRFTWIGFLEPGEDGVLALGDAFETPNNGTWFGSLSASQRLVIEPPPGYEVSDVSQGFSYSISDRRIVAEGPQTFAAGDISIRYEPGETAPPPFPYQLIAGAVVVLLFIVALVAYRRGGVSTTVTGDSVTAAPENGDAATDDADRSETAVDADTRPNDSTPDSAGPTSGPSNGPPVDGDAGGTAADSAADATVTGVGAAEANGSEPDTEEDLELLSDEERVERLLDSHGGRMRQGTIVTETGWSDAKVSQLLSAMADDGRVEKLRLGRENLISLADGDGNDPDNEP